MIRSTPVACSSARMLRPSRPMIRPFISSDGRWTTETVCSAVWSAATRCIAVTTMSRALSWASSRAARSIARASLTASCSASSRTASSRTRLGVLGGHARRRARARRPARCGRGRGPRGSCRARARARGACGRAARACRCAGRAARRAGAGGVSRPASSLRLARASSSASRCMRSFSSFASRMSSFWRARASASMRRASDWAAFIVCEAHRLRTKTPTTAPPTAATRATATTTRCVHFVFLPSGRLRAGRHHAVRWLDRSMGWAGRCERAGSLPGPRSSRAGIRRRSKRHVVDLLRSLRRGAEGQPSANRPATERR